MKILFRNEPYIIIDFAHVKQSMRAAFVRTKMKHLLTGLVHEETFRSGEKFELPDLAYREMQYLYNDENFYYFMDQKSYDQQQFSADQIADIRDYLKEQGTYTFLYFNDRPVAATPPLFVELAVVETQPGIRGDTAQGGATK